MYQMTNFRVAIRDGNVVLAYVEFDDRDQAAKSAEENSTGTGFNTVIEYLNKGSYQFYQKYEDGKLVEIA